MTIWIIIGSLVGLVAIFLIVMSIKDRKKVKIENAEREELDFRRQNSRQNVALFLNQVILSNEKLLKTFVPSVGKLKMGDIKNKAKDELTYFQNMDTYKLASETEKNEDLIDTYKKFVSTNSNIWSKKLEPEIKMIQKEVKEMDKEFLEEHKSEYKDVVKRVEKNEHTK